MSNQDEKYTWHTPGWRTVEYLEDYNENHDPKSGEFSSGEGGSGGSQKASTSTKQRSGKAALKSRNKAFAEIKRHGGKEFATSPRSEHAQSFAEFAEEGLVNLTKIPGRQGDEIWKIKAHF